MAIANSCLESVQASPESDPTPSWKLINRILALSYHLDQAGSVLTNETLELPAQYQGHLCFLAESIRLIAAEIQKSAEVLDLRTGVEDDGEGA